MSISAYTGLPGHGKSYGVVENVIYPALKDERLVFTNIPLVEKELAELSDFYVPFDIQDIVDSDEFWDNERLDGAVVVIDEIWRLWPAGLTAKQIRAKDKEFLAEHRHRVCDKSGLSTEIVYVTQDLAQISSFARLLVEMTYRVTKLIHVKQKNRYRVDSYIGAVTGQPPVSKRHGQFFGKFDKSIYRLYKSHTKSKRAGLDGQIDKRAGSFLGAGGRLFLWALPALLFGIYYGFSELKAEYSHEKETEISEVEARPESYVSGSIGVPEKPERAESLSDSWLEHVDKASIVSNNGISGHYHYRLAFVIDEDSIVLGVAELERLGFQLVSIDQCLVILQAENDQKFVTCSQDKKQRSVAESLLVPDSVEL